MRSRTLRLAAPLVLIGSLLAGSPAQSQDLAQVPRADPSFWQASGGVVAANGLTWAYNWYVQRWHWANVGTRAWWQNLRGGFVWDDDAFMDNQLAHPYHGSLYFNAARASGYGFWGSTPFVAGGSIGWELLTENVRPSLNDLINTTLGGIALGEVTYRLSTWLTSSGGGSLALGRETGAFVLSPMGRTQELLNGRERRARRYGYAGPETGATFLAVGRRRGTSATGDEDVDDRTMVALAFQYGSPFEQGIRKPYDAFEFNLQLSPEQAGVITHAAVSGLLTRRTLRQSSHDHLVLGLFQHFDYDDVPGFRSSGQSVSGALLYRRQAGRRLQIGVGLHLETVLLGAVLSDHGHIRNRDYDYGPGLGGRFTASLRRDGRDLLRFDGRTTWIHSLYGTDADHLATTARVSAAVPVLRTVGVGGDAGLSVRRSFYRDQRRVVKHTPQVRAYLIWSPS